LPAKDYSELTDVYDDSIRVMKQLVDLSQLLNGARAETLKAEQRKLTEEVYHIKSRELGRMLSFLGLKAQLGMSHVAWQDRANRMAQKRNLLMVREKMTNLAQDRMNEIKN
jgi:hypothetical protein